MLPASRLTEQYLKKIALTTVPRETSYKADDLGVDMLGAWPLLDIRVSVSSKEGVELWTEVLSVGVR